MAVFDIFSKRQRRLRREVPEVYQYNNLPSPFRVQVIHIIRDAIGEQKQSYGNFKGPKQYYEYIHKSLCREYGVFTLSKREIYADETDEESVFNFLLQTVEHEKAIDVIEYFLKQSA